jgi:hypothetical protein
MRNQGTLIIGALITALAGACGEDFTIADEPLSGTIGGESWTFVEGETNFFLSEGQDDWFAELYAEDYEPCGFGAPQDGNSLIVAIPMELGEFELSSSLSMTFVVDTDDGIDNLVSFDGVVRVDSFDGTTLVGGLAAAFDDDNEVSGTFELSICPDDGF